MVLAITCEWNLGRGVLTGIISTVYIVVFIAILKQRKSRFSSAYYTYVISLAISDFITIIYIVILGATACPYPNIRWYLYSICEGADIAGLLNMICISVYRYVAVAYPTKVLQIFSYHRQMISLIFMRVFGVLWGFYFAVIYIVWPSCIGEEFGFDGRPYAYPLAIISLTGVTVIWSSIVTTGIKLRKIRKGKLGEVAFRNRELKLYISNLITSLLLIYFKGANILSDLATSDSVTWMILVQIGESITYVAYSTANPFLYLALDNEVRRATKDLLLGSRMNSVRSSSIRTVTL